MGISKAYTVKLLLAKETKWTLLEVITHATFLEILILKSDSGSVKLQSLSGNGPQIICFGKAMYRLHVYVEIHEMDITSMNKRMTESKQTGENLDLFVVTLRRAVFNSSTNRCFKFFLNFTYIRETEFTVSFISF